MHVCDFLAYWLELSLRRREDICGLVSASVALWVSHYYFFQSNDTEDLNLTLSFWTEHIKAEEQSESKIFES